MNTHLFPERGHDSIPVLGLIHNYLHAKRLERKKHVSLLTEVQVIQSWEGTIVEKETRQTLAVVYGSSRTEVADAAVPFLTKLPATLEDAAIKKVATMFHLKMVVEGLDYEFTVSGEGEDFFKLQEKLATRLFFMMNDVISDWKAYPDGDWQYVQSQVSLPNFAARPF